MDPMFVAVGVFVGEGMTWPILTENLCDRTTLDNKALEIYEVPWASLNSQEKRNVSLHLSSEHKVELRDHREMGVVTPFVCSIIGQIDEMCAVNRLNLPYEKILEAVDKVKAAVKGDGEVVMYVGRGC